MTKRYMAQNWQHILQLIYFWKIKAPTGKQASRLETHDIAFLTNLAKEYDSMIEAAHFYGLKISQPQTQ